MIATMLNVKPKDVQNMESRLAGGDQYLNQPKDFFINEIIILQSNKCYAT